jgi:hypothetical protein
MIYNTNGDFLMKFNKKVLFLPLILVVLLICLIPLLSSENGSKVKYIDFRGMFESGDVNTASIEKDIIRFTLKSASRRVLYRKS